MTAHADRRDAFAQRIYEYWNPGSRWSEAHPDDVIAYRADADIAMAAADALSGITYTPPTRSDIYREVADRLAAYAGTQKEDAPIVVRTADAVRGWADRADSFRVGDA